MKDWGTYRKLFDKLDTDFEMLPFFARATAAEVIRRGDRVGRLVRGDKVDERLFASVAFHVRAHPHELEMLQFVIEVLVKDSYLVFADGWLRIRNFVEAQRSESADRMAKKRARDAQGEPGSPDPIPPPTRGRSDESDDGDVTPEQTEPLHAGASSRLVSSGFVSDPPDPEKHGTKKKPGSARAAADPPYAMHDAWQPPDDEVKAQAIRLQATEKQIWATVPEFRIYWKREGSKRNTANWIRSFVNRLSQLAKRGELWVDDLKTGPRAVPPGMQEHLKAKDDEARAQRREKLINLAKAGQFGPKVQAEAESGEEIGELVSRIERGLERHAARKAAGGSS